MEEYTANSRKKRLRIGRMLYRDLARMKTKKRSKRLQKKIQAWLLKKARISKCKQMIEK